MCSAATRPSLQNKNIICWYSRWQSSETWSYRSRSPLPPRCQFCSAALLVGPEWRVVPMGYKRSQSFWVTLDQLMSTHEEKQVIKKITKSPAERILSCIKITHRTLRLFQMCVSVKAHIWWWNWDVDDFNLNGDCKQPIRVRSQGNNNKKSNGVASGKMTWVGPTCLFKAKLSWHLLNGLP